MKKLFPGIFFALLALNASTMLAENNTDVPVSPRKPAADNKLLESEIAGLSSHYDEFNNMDKGKTTPTEIKELRNESSSIKDDLTNQSDTIIYFSSAAVIILLVILLIILL